MEKINKYIVLGALVLLVSVVGISYEYNKRKIEETKETYKEKLKEEKEIRDSLKEEISEQRELNIELTKRTVILTDENRELKESSKKSRFKLIKPDGTIVEREYEETNREEVSRIVTNIRQEFDTKVKTIENRWKKVYKQRVIELKKERDLYKEKYTSLEEETSRKINEKRFTISIGKTIKDNQYIHTTYNFSGPFIISAGTIDTGEVLLGVGIML